MQLKVCYNALTCFPIDPDQPQNFTATPLSPSTVKFTWEPPTDFDNENGNFIVTCKPEPYQFPLSTSSTVLTASHFNPDTDYTCMVFTAYAASLNSTTNVQFKTRM